MEILMRPKREPLTKPLEVHGTSKNNTLVIYPLLEEPVLPYSFTQGEIYDALSAYSQNAERAKATPRTPALVATAQRSNGVTPAPRFYSGGLDDSMCLSMSQAWTTWARKSSAGHYTTTDRSSASSGMSVDDFEREASAKMQLLFDDVDAALFERQDVEPVADDIYQECRHWNDAFPHFRLLGRQLAATRDTGFELIAAIPRQAPAAPEAQAMSMTRMQPAASSGNDSRPSNGHDKLSLEGLSLSLKPLDRCPGISAVDMARLTEDIIEQDGVYEDVIAIDDGASELSGHSRAARKSYHCRGSRPCTGRHKPERSHCRSRYPPVTPAACTQDNVAEAVFDTVWRTVTATLRPVLRRYAHTFALLPLVSEHGPQPEDAAGATSLTLGHYDGRAHRVGDANKFPQIYSQPSSRADRGGSAMAFASHSSSRHTPLMHMSPLLTMSRQRLTFSSQGVWHGSHVVAADPGEEGKAKLGNILTISKKEMQTRDKLYSEELGDRDTPTAASMMRADSSMRLDHVPAHHTARKESSGSVAAIVAHMNAIAASASQGKKGSGTAASAVTTGRRSRLAPLPDRSLTPYADDTAAQHGVAVSLHRLHMTGKKIASPVLSSPAAGPLSMLPVDSRVGGSVLPPIISQTAAALMFEPNLLIEPDVTQARTFRSPAPPLQSLSSARPAVRRRFADRIGSALTSAEKISQTHSPSLILQHNQRDKQTSAIVGAGGAASPRPSTTHGFTGARVNIQFAGIPEGSYGSSRAPFTPLGISPLAKAGGSLHSVAYRRNKVLNSFAR